MEQPQPPERAGGSIPNDWGNTLARRWAPDLPRPLVAGFLQTLYALRTLASANGALRYKNGRIIPIGEIVAACRSDERDVRTYLTAAIAAGVLGGDREPGKATVYTLILTPWPNWAAAAAVVENGRRSSGTDAPQWPSRSGAPGHRTPGHRAPDMEPTTPGHRAPARVGAPCPDDPGAPCPDQPGITRELHQEMADVVPQPQDVRAQDHPADEPEPIAVAPLAAAPDPPPGSRVPRSRTPAVPDGQAPLLLSVPGTGADVPPPGPDMGQVITDLTVHGREAALARYGGRLVARAATLAGRTGT